MFMMQQQPQMSSRFIEKNLATFEEPDEAVSFGGGDKLFLADGRPVQLDFDNVYVERPPVGYIHKPPVGYLDTPPTGDSAKIV